MLPDSKCFAGSAEKTIEAKKLVYEEEEKDEPEVDREEEVARDEVNRGEKTDRGEKKEDGWEDVLQEDKGHVVGEIDRGPQSLGETNTL